MTITQKVRTSVYLDETVKDRAKELFKKYHLSLSDALNMFLAQSVLEQGLPFDMKIPKDIEIVNPDDEDYKLVEETKNDDTISLEEFLKV